MTTKPRSLFNEIQFYISLFPMLIIIGVAAISLLVVSYNMLTDLRERALNTAGELTDLLEYPMYIVDDEQAKRIAKTFLASGKVSGIILESKANGLLLSESNGKETHRIPMVTRELMRNGLPLGTITMTFSDEEIVHSVKGFVAIALIVVLTLILTNMAINRYYMTQRVRRSFEPVLSAISNVAEGNYELLVDPTPYQDVNIIIDHLNEMSNRIHQKNHEQQQTQKELREGQRLLEGTFASLHDAVFIIDVETMQIINCNPAASTIFGYDREDMIGKETGFLHVDEASLQEFRSHLLPVIQKEGRFSLSDFRMRRKDGAVFPTEHNVMRLTNDIGESEGWISVVRDITVRKKIEKERQQYHSQILQSQKMEAIGTLAGGIAHDFNNLLMSIQGRASLMSFDLEDSHPCYEHVYAIMEATKSAADLTKQLLGMGRGGRYEVRAIDINDVVIESANLFGRTKKEIRIDKKLHKPPPVVAADQGQIEQVLLNIYINAWQAMPQGGELSLETGVSDLDEDFCRPHSAKPGKYAKISITDSGIGMDKATQARIFDPFFTTKEKSRGTGLGLSSAYGIVKNHSGIITVHSVAGQGATFILFLPLSEGAVKRDTVHDKSIEQGIGTILLVDDEKMVLDVGTAMLDKLGYQVILAENGQKAIDSIIRSGDQIDLVILDMIMPGMGGAETFDRIREINSEIPVILSSGYSIDGQAADIMKKGCKGFIQKPFSLTELSQRVMGIIAL